MDEVNEISEMLCQKLTIDDNSRHGMSSGTIKNQQSRDTVNIGHRKHRMKINKAQKHNTTQKTKKKSNTDPTKTGGEPTVGARWTK
jgi:hypothetical protein